jgi:5'-deoxynucleotidase YfbR-like HD superfamily hydrolase
VWFSYILKHEKDKELWKNQIAKESLESRAVKIMGALQLCIKVNTEIALDNKQDAKARTEASIKVVVANFKAFQVLEDGPKPSQILLPT